MVLSFLLSILKEGESASCHNFSLETSLNVTMFNFMTVSPVSSVLWRIATSELLTDGGDPTTSAFLII